MDLEDLTWVTQIMSNDGGHAQNRPMDGYLFNAHMTLQDVHQPWSNRNSRDA